MVAVEGAVAAGADRQTVQRLVEKGLALVPSDPVADPFPNQTAYLRTVPAFEAWAAGDGEAAGAMLDELRASLPAEGPARSAMQHHLGDQYLALGRVREAEDLYRNGGRLPGGSRYMPDMDLAAIALAKGHTPAFRRQARLMYEAVGADFAGDRADGLRTWFLTRAGMRREAEHVAARALSENAVEVAYVLGEVAAIQGKDAAAVDHLRTEFLRSPAFDSGLFGWWWRGHETIADALVRLGDVAGAIRDLELVLAKAKNANPQTGSHGFWCVRVRAKLADLLRSAGRASDAETIERELRRLLVHADPDFEIAARLAQRQPAPSPFASATDARSSGARPASSASRRGPGAR
jgi:tetratricopeptide (TPR) repeat protein